jgi:hypothetical protein
MSEGRCFSEEERQWYYDTLGNEDYGILWGQQYEVVLLAALNGFVRDDQRQQFDFDQLRPRLSDFPLKWREFHSTHILPVAALIQPLQPGVVSELTMKQRYVMVAPLIRDVINALSELEQLEFMREEIEGDFQTILRWYEGQANGRSWIESFFGKPVPYPRSCSEMARRA